MKMCFSNFLMIDRGESKVAKYYEKIWSLIYWDFLIYSL